MANELIQNYQEVIVKIVLASLKSVGRPVGREIFISMLKGRKDSKIVKSKYYINEYYGIFSFFRGGEIAYILDYLIESGIIQKEDKGNIIFIYTTKNINDAYKYSYDFIGYISDKSMNIITKEDEDLYSRLKAVRFSLAIKNNLKPYSICSDKILRDICMQKPKNKNELYRIYGIGEKFIENYSDIFLTILNEYN